MIRRLTVSRNRLCAGGAVERLRHDHRRSDPGRAYRKRSMNTGQPIQGMRCHLSNASSELLSAIRRCSGLEVHRSSSDLKIRVPHKGQPDRRRHGCFPRSGSPRRGHRPSRICCFRAGSAYVVVDHLTGYRYTYPTLAAAADRPEHGVRRGATTWLESRVPRGRERNLSNRHRAHPPVTETRKLGGEARRAIGHQPRDRLSRNALVRTD